MDASTAAYRPIVYPDAAIEALLARPYGPMLGNFLAVLSAADAALSRDGQAFGVPFGELVPAGVAVMLECAARSAEMMTASGRYLFTVQEFAAAARRAAQRVTSEKAGLILPIGGIPERRQ